MFVGGMIIVLGHCCIGLIKHKSAAIEIWPDLRISCNSVTGGTLCGSNRWVRERVGLGEGIGGVF